MPVSGAPPHNVDDGQLQIILTLEFLFDRFELSLIFVRVRPSKGCQKHVNVRQYHGIRLSRGKQLCYVMFTTSQAGFLAYGPYQHLNAGRYRLTVKGEASEIKDAWVDVVSHKGSIQHANSRSSIAGNGSAGVLTTGEVSLDSSVDDIEVRVYVSASDVVRLNGYELIAVKSK